MPNEFVPDGITKMYATLVKIRPHWGLIFSGSMGDSNHHYGYHVPGHRTPSGDYSDSLSRDRDGNQWCSSAIDISGPSWALVNMTNNMRHAALIGNPWWKQNVREFAGRDANGNVFSMDMRDIRTGLGNFQGFDSSHETHEHISFYRDTVTNLHWWHLARVIAGVATWHP